MKPASNRKWGLWHNADFRQLWLGQTVSMLGSQITYLAIPLIAVQLLQAGSIEMGLLTAASTAPYFIIGLFAGVWVDRARRIPILRNANLIGGLLLSLIPLLHALDWLTMESLYVIAFMTAACSMIFQFAYQALLPSIVSREELTEGNSKLEATRATSQFAGPAAAGALIQSLTAPFAIWIDVATYMISVAMFGRMKKKEILPAVPRQSTFGQIKSGFSLVFSNAFLRTIAYSTALLNFSRCAFDAVYVLFLVQKLSVHAGQIGLVYGFGSIGAVLGAVAARRLSAKFGTGLCIIGSSMLIGSGYLLVSTASGSIGLILPLLVIAQMCSSMGNTIYFVTQVSLRQAVTPNEMLGRVNATQTFISRGAIPLGALLGGVLGLWLGLRGAVFFSGCLSLVTVLLLLLSPVRSYRHAEGIEQSDNRKSA